MRCASSPPFANRARSVLVLGISISETPTTRPTALSPACIAATRFTPSVRSASETMA